MLLGEHSRMTQRLVQTSVRVVRDGETPKFSERSKSTRDFTSSEGNVSLRYSTTEHIRDEREGTFLTPDIEIVALKSQ